MFHLVRSQAASSETSKNWKKTASGNPGMEFRILDQDKADAALLPFLLTKPQATILNVTSQLAFVPVAMIPTYCATKAALHSYTQSLRFQLRNSSVQVIEIIPPWVQTELQGERGRNPRAMPLDEYTAETMSILKNSPETTEIVVERAKLLRFAERGGDFDAFFAKFNESWLASQTVGANVSKETVRTNHRGVRH